MNNNNKLQKFSDILTIISLITLTLGLTVNLITKNMTTFYIEAIIAYILIIVDVIKSIHRGYF